MSRRKKSGVKSLGNNLDNFGASSREEDPEYVFYNGLRQTHIDVELTGPGPSVAPALILQPASEPSPQLPAILLAPTSTSNAVSDTKMNNEDLRYMDMSTDEGLQREDYCADATFNSTSGYFNMLNEQSLELDEEERQAMEDWVPHAETKHHFGGSFEYRLVLGLPEHYEESNDDYFNLLAPCNLEDTTVAMEAMELLPPASGLVQSVEMPSTSQEAARLRQLAQDGEMTYSAASAGGSFMCCPPAAMEVQIPYSPASPGYGEPMEMPPEEIEKPSTSQEAARLRQMSQNLGMSFSYAAPAMPYPPEELTVEIPYSPASPGFGDSVGILQKCLQAPPVDAEKPSTSQEAARAREMSQKVGMSYSYAAPSMPCPPEELTAQIPFSPASPGFGEPVEKKRKHWQVPPVEMEQPSTSQEAARTRQMTCSIASAGVSRMPCPRATMKLQLPFWPDVGKPQKPLQAPQAETEKPSTSQEARRALRKSRNRRALQPVHSVSPNCRGLDAKLVSVTPPVSRAGTPTGLCAVPPPVPPKVPTQAPGTGPITDWLATCSSIVWQQIQFLEAIVRSEKNGQGMSSQTAHSATFAIIDEEIKGHWKPLAKTLSAKWLQHFGAGSMENISRTLYLPAAFLSIDMKFTNMYSVVHTHTSLHLPHTVRRMSAVMYRIHIDVIHHSYDSLRNVWIWSNGTVVIINGSSRTALLGIQKKVIASLSERPTHNLGPTNSSYVTLVTHTTYPWRINLVAFGETQTLWEPISSKRYVYYVAKDLPGVVARVHDSGQVYVYGNSQALVDKILDRVYGVTKKYRIRS